MIWKPNFTRKENKTDINMAAWQGDCSISGRLEPADLWDGGEGGGKRKRWNLVRSISLEPFCETALWEKIREYQKWRSEVIRRQMVLWLWNNRWVRAEAAGYPGRSALGAPVRAVCFLTTCRPVLSGFVLIWCLSSLLATKMISVPTSTTEGKKQYGR